MQSRPRATPPPLASGMSGPRSRVRARRQRSGTCCHPSVTFGCAGTRSFRWLPCGRGGAQPGRQRAGWRRMYRMAGSRLPRMAWPCAVAENLFFWTSWLDCFLCPANGRHRAVVEFCSGAQGPASCPPAAPPAACPRPVIPGLTQNVYECSNTRVWEEGTITKSWPCNNQTARGKFSLVAQPWLLRAQQSWSGPTSKCRTRQPRCTHACKPFGRQWTPACAASKLASKVEPSGASGAAAATMHARWPQAAATAAA